MEYVVQATDVCVYSISTSIGCCHSNTAIVILSVYFFKMTKYQFLIIVLLTIFLNGTTFVISMLLRLM